MIDRLTESEPEDFSYGKIKEIITDLETRDRDLSS